MRILTILMTTLLTLTALNANAQSKILVYSGPGAGPKSLANTLATLQDVVSDKYQVTTISPEELLANNWQADAALLVFPGGADRPYMEKLRGQGNKIIREYVQNGGKFLGICAGAYYGADRIEFAKNDPELAVVEERELKFFPGIIEGPTYVGFDHRETNNVAGMRAASLVTSRSTYTIFYNGGGHFVNAEQYPNVEILAHYAPELPHTPKQNVAIVKCKVGKGTALLSGPHFEWQPHTLDDARIEEMKRSLLKAEQQRLAFTKQLLQQLQIDVR